MLVGRATEEIVRHLRDGADPVGRTRMLAAAIAADPSSFETLLRGLRAEAERTFAADPHACLRLAEALVEGARLADRKDFEALGLMTTADALRNVGRFEESITFYDESARTYQALGDEVGWARTRVGWLFACQRLGRGEQALAVVSQARQVFERHSEWARAASLDMHTAFVCKELGNYRRALAYYDQALAVYAGLDPTVDAQEARAKANKAVALSHLGDFQAALALHEEARKTFVRLGETVSVHRQDQNIALVHAGRGDYTRALRHYDQALTGFERAGLDIDASWVGLSLLECYLSLNRYLEALALADETAARFERCGAPTEAARARYFGAQVRGRLGDPDGASKLLTAAAETFASAGMPQRLAYVALASADLALKRGDPRAALIHGERAHTLFAECGLDALAALSGVVHGRAALALGEISVADERAAASLDVAHRHTADWLEQVSHHLRGGVASARGMSDAAFTSFEDAMAAIDRIQGRLATELRTNFLADKLALFHDAITCALDADEPARAFGYLERSKSRALVDYLATHPGVRLRSSDSAAQVVLDELAEVRAEHNWLSAQLHSSVMARRVDDHLGDAAATTLRDEIERREVRIARLQERLALRHAKPVADVLPATPGILAEPPKVDESTVLLEYYLHDHGGVVFVVTGGDLRVVPLEGGPKPISRLLGQWQLNLDASAAAAASRSPLDALGHNARGILAELYRLLIAPVEWYLNDRQRVVIIPYGPAHSVPFHALFSGGQFLLERLEVSVCPSSSLLRLCAARPRRPGRTALTLAHSAGGRLPAAVREAQRVAAILGGETYLEDAASGAALTDAAARHAVIHLATHGEARLDNPAFAHLLLADGQLNAADVFNLPLDGALVTLSACETGRAQVTGGDELVGLSRGFLFAGAATLIQSLWRVEDESTATLMERFYGALKSGASAGAALRAAQLDAAARESHPFRWAPFQLVGDSGPLA